MVGGGENQGDKPRLGWAQLSVSPQGFGRGKSFRGLRIFHLHPLFTGQVFMFAKMLVCDDSGGRRRGAVSNPPPARRSEAKSGGGEGGPAKQDRVGGAPRRALTLSLLRRRMPPTPDPSPATRFASGREGRRKERVRVWFRGMTRNLQAVELTRSSHCTFPLIQFLMACCLICSHGGLRFLLTAPPQMTAEPRKSATTTRAPTA